MTDHIIVVQPGGGRHVPRRFREQTVIKVGEDETRGAYAVRENAAPPWFDTVPLHVHRTAEEAFYVLEGELTVVEGTEVFVAPSGSFVLIPRGTPHAIANQTDTTVRWLTIISPAWVSHWIEEEAERADQVAEVYEKYGLELVGPPPLAHR